MVKGQCHRCPICTLGSKVPFAGERLHRVPSAPVFKDAIAFGGEPQPPRLPNAGSRAADDGLLTWNDRLATPLGYLIGPDIDHAPVAITAIHRT